MMIMVMGAVSMTVKVTVMIVAIKILATLQCSEIVAVTSVKNKTYEAAETKSRLECVIQTVPFSESFAFECTFRNV